MTFLAITPFPRFATLVDFDGSSRHSEKNRIDELGIPNSAA